MSGRLGEYVVLGSLMLTAGGQHGQTQADMNEGACAQYKKADQFVPTLRRNLRDQVSETVLHRSSVLFLRTREAFSCPRRTCE